MKKILSQSSSYIVFGVASIVLLLPRLSLAALQFAFENPLKFTSVEELLLAILNIVIVIAVPIVILFIIYAGFLYVTAKGNATQVQDATRALTYAVIGGVLIIGAVAIAQIIANLVNAFKA